MHWFFSLLILTLFFLKGTFLVGQSIDVNELFERLNRIEKNIEDLQKNKIEELEKNISSGYISRTEERFGNLENQSQNNFGKQEELDYKIENLGKKFNLFDQEINFRLNEILKKLENLNFNISENEDQEQNIDLNRNDESLSESNNDDNKSSQFSEAEIKEKYENAIKLLWSNELDKALKELVKLRDDNPQDLMPNIQYWLGEVYYAKKILSRQS